MPTEATTAAPSVAFATRDMVVGDDEERFAVVGDGDGGGEVKAGLASADRGPDW